MRTKPQGDLATFTPSEERRNHGLPVLLLAVVLAGVAQFFLGHIGNLSVGLLLYTLTALIFVTAAPGGKLLAHTLEIASPASLRLHDPRFRRTRAKAGALLVTAFVLLGLALWRFGWDSANLLGWLLFLGALGTYAVAGRLLTQLQGPPSAAGAKAPVKRALLAALGGITLLAAVLRTYKLGEVPFGLWVDEAMHGLGPFRADPLGLYIYVSSVNIASPFVLLQAALGLALGQTIEAVRLGSALLGILTVPLFYLLARRFMARPEAVAATFLLAVSFWHLVWSRSGMPGATAPLVAALAVYLLLRSFGTGKLSDYVLAGMALGLSAWAYQGLRVFPLVPVAFLAYLAISRKGFLREHATVLTAYFTACLLVASPILQYSAVHFADFWGRAQEVSLLAGADSLADAMRRLQTTTLNHLGMFHYAGDPNGRHNVPGNPLLGSGTGILFALGAAYALRRVTSPLAFLLLTWLAVMTVPGILTVGYETPHSLRAIGTLPPVYLLAGIAIGRVREQLPSFRVDRVRRGLAALLLVALAAIGLVNVHTYFQSYAHGPQTVEDFYPRETLIALRLREKLSEETGVYATPYFNLHLAMAYLAPGRPLPVHLDVDDLPIPYHADGALLLIDGRRADLLERVRDLYPAASMQEISVPGSPGTPGLYEIRLTTEDLGAVQAGT